MSRAYSDPRLLQVANVFAVLATIAFNGWSNAAPLNGVTMAELSRSYPSLFTPAGWAFSIWGAIYAGLLVFAVFQVRPGQRQRPYLLRIGWLHAATFVCNATWIVVFHFSYGRPGMVPLTLIPMYGLFACLLAIYLRLPIGLEPVGSAEKLAVHIPFSLYIGWVTVATMANTAFVVNATIPGIPLAIQRVLAVVLLLVVLAIGLLILRNRRDVAFALAVVWAAIGIAAESSAYAEITATAAATALIVACTILVLPRLRGQSFDACYLH